jgi:hypothetical protein
MNIMSLFYKINIICQENIDYLDYFHYGNNLLKYKKYRIRNK